MELNITSQPKAIAPIRATLQKKSTKKGSWKKRRVEYVLQRAKDDGSGEKGRRPQQKGGALKIQAEEFSSGIENAAVKRPLNDVLRDGKQNKRLRRKESKIKLEELPNVVVEGVGTKSKVAVRDKLDDIRKPKLKTTPSQSRAPLDRPDQTPAAVSATLAIIGNESKEAIKVSKNNEIEKPKSPSMVKEADPKATDKQLDQPFGVSSFKDTGLYHSVVHHVVNRLGMEHPTKIQEKVLKAMINLADGQQSLDLLVRSATGSGKTLAYLLPIAHYLLNRSKRISRADGSMAIIVVPTRELADQVHEVAEKLFRSWHWIVVGSVVGGESKKREKARLRKGTNVLVATPGRLLDHMRNTQSFLYGFCEFLVLDEADRLLDLGFEGELKELIENLDKQARFSNPDAGKTRSNMLLSATLRKDVEHLAKFSLKDPVEISVDVVHGEDGKKFAMPLHLKQHFCVVEQRHRLVTLACFLRLRAMKDTKAGDNATEQALHACKIIVFFSSCDSVDFHFDLLKGAKVPSELKKTGLSEEQTEPLLPLSVFKIHGNHLQSDRIESLRSFRKSRRAVLLCTDVAARGLDLKGLTFAIQYDPPTGGQGEELEYLHRAGRTARIGARGDALLFLLPSERAYVGKLESRGVSIAEISGSAALAALYPKVDLSKQGSISYATRLVTSAVQQCLEEVVKDNEELREKAVCGFQAYCRAYATHARDVRYFFHVRNLHLGHVARSFTLSDKPAEFTQMMADIKGLKSGDGVDVGGRGNGDRRMDRRKGAIARAIADGEKQPFNNQSSALARRRREKGRGEEAFKELAMEFET